MDLYEAIAALRREFPSWKWCIYVFLKPPKLGQIARIGIVGKLPSSEADQLIIVTSDVIEVAFHEAIRQARDL